MHEKTRLTPATPYIIQNIVNTFRSIVKKVIRNVGLQVSSCNSYDLCPPLVNTDTHRQKHYTRSSWPVIYKHLRQRS